MSIENTAFSLIFFCRPTPVAIETNITIFIAIAVTPIFIIGDEMLLYKTYFL